MRLRTFVIALAVLAVAGGAAFHVLTLPAVAVKGELPPRPADLANGETMFNIGGCASCHATPGQEDGRRLGGGLALATAFGTFVVPNISSDPQHGIGAWSEQSFVNAMLRGVGRNGEHLYPAFPYTSYQRMALDDVRDLFAFLKTLPAETTPSAPHRLSFPFTLRRGIGLWKLINLDGRAFAPDPAKSAPLNRGAYLVNGPGHCAECHSARDILGAIVAKRRFAGGPALEGKGWVPNITPHADGIGAWSENDIAYFLEVGLTPSFASVGSAMAGVVLNTAKLSADDRAAMAVYLKTLPPRPGKAPPRKS
ncbi:MAG: c-type cytochrome [Hyphomicrobiaceae bacterium]|nr:MAG: c-type cytochrome [Hyphomicrobiaceae bacterium]